MHETLVKDVRRAAAVVTVQEGCAPLPREVWDYLGTDEGPLFLKVQKEILLTDDLAAKIGILKWLPWIVEAQNSDGSWGDEGHRDAATFAVVSAGNA